MEKWPPKLKMAKHPRQLQIFGGHFVEGASKVWWRVISGRQSDL